MSNLSSSEYVANLNELIQRYLNTSKALDAYRRIHQPGNYRHRLKAPQRAASPSLRGLRAKFIREAHIKELLDFYSVLQIAYLAGYIQPFFDKRFTKATIKTLNIDHVKVYRLEHYQSLLPTDLATRLENGYSLPVADNDHNIFLFYQFLDLKALLEEDKELKYFLTKVCNDKSGDFELLLANNTEMDLERNSYTLQNDTAAMDGYLRYIDFIHQCYQLLSAVCEKPDLEAAFVNYFITAFYCPKSRLLNILDKSIKLAEQLKSSKEELLPDALAYIDRNLDYINKQMEAYTNSGIYA